MGFQRGVGSGSRHIGNEAEVEFSGGPVRKNGLAAGSGIAADQTFDVDGRLGDEKFEGFEEIDIVNPARDAHQLLRGPFILTSRGLADHCFFGGANGPGFIGKVVDRGRVTVLFDQSCEGLNKVPGRAIDAGFVARVNVLGGSSTPSLAAGNEFEFDDALTQVDPKLDVTADHALFTTPEKFEGQGARVTGVLQSRFVKGLAVLQVGARRLAVEAPLENVWSAALTQGQRVEVVGVFAGLQTTAGQKLPLVHAVWARPAY